MANIALIIAGGNGKRMGSTIPKQFLLINKKPVIIYTLEKFQNHTEIDEIYVVCLDYWKDFVLEKCKEFKINKPVHTAPSGPNGQDSIRNGLLEINKRFHSDRDIVLIHDAIRPMVSEEIISDCLRVCKKYGNAVASISCDTAILKSDNKETAIEQVPREYLQMTQTPQAFFINDLLTAHKEALERGITASVASCTMFVELGKSVALSLGSKNNIKITSPEDLSLMEALLLVEQKKKQNENI